MAKKKINGFSLFVSEYNRNSGRPECEKWNTMDEAKEVWESLTEEEKINYKERAKAISSGAPVPPKKVFLETVPRGNSLPRPRVLRELTLPEIRSYVDKCLDDFRACNHRRMLTNPAEIPNIDFIFLSFSVLSDVPFYDKNYGEFVMDLSHVPLDFDYVSIHRVNVIPVEVTVLQYSLKDGLKRAFHELISPGPIPMGYKFAAYKSSDETHQIPVDGHPDAKTMLKVTEMLDHIGEFVKNKKICVYVLSSEFEAVSQSLTYLSKMTGYKNNLFPILRVEDLIIDLVNFSGVPDIVNSLSIHEVRSILDAVSMTYNEKLRCRFHYDLCCRFCSMVRVLTFTEFLHTHITSLYKIRNTNMHKPISVTLNDVPFEFED